MNKKTLWSYVNKHKKTLIIAMFFLIFSTTINIVNPIILSHILDNVFSSDGKAKEAIE